MNNAYSNSAKIIGKGVAAAVFTATMSFASLAHAQERHERPDHAREHYQTPHWVYDSRFHHNHYYPSVGYSLTILPPGAISVTYRTGRFFFHSGVWYQAAGPGYVVVRPPLGVVVPVLPPGYTVVWAAGVPYYYANDIYYAATPGGYTVAAPPMEAMPAPAQSAPPPAPPPVPQAPQAAPAPSAPANWYYCESAKAYYPYVAECKEGWRAVPAAPPQPR